MIKRRVAAKHVARARKIMEAQIDDTQMQQEAAEKALQCVEAALEARPGNDKAMEMKARLLLRLKRFAEVVELLRHHLPSTAAASTASSLQVASTPKMGGDIDESGGGEMTSVCQSPASSTVSAASNSSSVVVFADSATKHRNSSVRRSDRINPAERTRLLYSGQLDADEADPFYSFPCRSVPTLAAYAKSCCNDALRWIWRRIPRPQLCIMSPWNHSAGKNWRRRRSEMKATTKQTAAQWQSLVLGRACWHLGMLEEAMVLLQQGKKTASAASRRQSNSMRDDRFVSSSTEHRKHGYHLRRRRFGREMMQVWRRKLDIDRLSSEAAAASKILESIKRLLRRRAAAMAAMEAGMYAESARHLTKIMEGGKKSAMAMPQGFMAECYLQRATASAATARVVDAIADCNRSLALLPLNAAALSLRASLLEMVRSYSDCLLDLQQLRLIYMQASLFHSRTRHNYADAGVSASLFLRNAHASTDLPAVLAYIDGKIASTRRNLRAAHSHYFSAAAAFSVDAHAILDIPKNCTTQDARRAFLLLSLKHRLDKAAHFVDACEFADVNLRDAETAREEAVASAARLSQLIRKAYRQLLSDVRGSSEEDESEEGEGGRGTASYMGDVEELREMRWRRRLSVDAAGRDIDDGAAALAATENSSSSFAVRLAMNVMDCHEGGGGDASCAMTSSSYFSSSSSAAAADVAAESIKDASKFHYDDVADYSHLAARSSPATWNANWAISP